MKHHLVSGGGGIQLHLVETGNSSRTPDCILSMLFSVLPRLDSTDEFCIGRKLSALLPLTCEATGFLISLERLTLTRKLWADDVQAVIQGARS